MNFYPYNHKNVVAIDGDLCVIRNEMGVLCGYCAFHSIEVPDEWHGNYSADALQYLAVHGGLTYGEVHGNNDAERYAAIRAAKDAFARPADGSSSEVFMEYWSARDKACDAAAKSIPYTHVVFGFDCGHYGDENNPSLRDPQYVLGLARQMREQIKAFAKILPQWREANRDQRLQMIEEIRGEAGKSMELGFGALIGAMGGANEFGEQATEH